jgi:hypothetical protein
VGVTLLPYRLPLASLYCENTNKIGILRSFLVIASTTHTAVKNFERPLDRSLALSIAANAIASFFAAHVANYIVIGQWKQFLVTYIFALEIFFDVDQLLPTSLDLLALPAPSLSMLAEILTVLRTCDAARSAQYLFPVVKGLAAPFALWPAIEASLKNPARLFLCVTATFFMTTLQLQKLATVLAHHAHCAHIASQQEQRRIASEYQEQVSAAIDVVHRVETEEQDLAAGSMRPYYDELCAYIREWQKAADIPKLLVVDVDASPEYRVPREPNGTRGINRSTRPVYDEEKLIPTVVRAISRKKRQRNWKRTDVFEAQSRERMIVVRARSSSPAPRDRKPMMVEEKSAC